MCLEGDWKVSGGCLEGIRKMSEECMQGKRWCLDNIKMVSRGQTFNFNLRPGQVRTDQVSQVH